MIHAAHLIWMLPAAALLGYVLCALLTANGRDNDK